ncbi:MAG TPA: class I SAM-dependent methyltransferase [Lysobacter sp.]
MRDRDVQADSGSVSDYDAHYTHYQLDRSPLRKLVRGLYLRSAARQLSGPTVDFGCGIGELLSRLPAGSVGLEINPASVEYCRSRGLDARLYDADADDWALSALQHRSDLRSLVVSHVLEHLDDPAAKLHRMLTACRRLGITRALAIVPGRSGYALDATHRTFIDARMLAADAVVAETGFAVQRVRYFPGNLRWLGDRFPHHELQVTYALLPTP